MRALLSSIAAVAAGTLTASLVAAAPASAKPAVVLTPGGLTRGADVSVPHLEGKTVVDGSVRVRVKAPTLRLLGKSGAAYVVATGNAQGGHGRIWRVAADGTRTLLTRANVYQTTLSGDGGRVVGTKVGRALKTTVTAYDATTGTQVATRTFKDYTSVLDAQNDQVLLGTTRKTLLWATGTDSVGVVSGDAGYVGDLSADVLGTFTKDPYDGGCTVVTRISTGQRLWRSCTEAVAAFNADGSRIATVGILSDGPGPGRVDARTISGQHLGRYQVRSGWFGTIEFESPTALLLEVNAARKAFTARCTATACERASDLRPAQTLRSS
jgi:hypothetical protein